MSRPITGQSTVDPEEHILRKVLGFRTVAGEPVADVKNAARVATHKFLPGRPVALEALLDQLGILLQRINQPLNLPRCKACLRAGFSL